MPSQPIIQYQPTKQTDNRLAQTMMMEKLGEGIAGASDILNKGIANYQKLKQDKQVNELSAIQAAGVLVGGVDKLPIETRNKLPGILDIDLPRDDKGNVILTPSAQDVVNRGIAKAAEADPITFGKVQAKMQSPARDPQEIEADARKDEVTRQGNILTYKGKELEVAYNQSKDKADRAQREEANFNDNITRIKVAEMKGPSSSSARADYLAAPSDFWINKDTGEVLSKPAIEAGLKPDEKIDDKWFNTTNANVKTHIDARKAESLVKRRQSEEELDKHRADQMDAKVKQMEAKDPQGIKAIMDGIRESEIIIAKGKGGVAEAKQRRDYLHKEWMKRLGQEAAPEDYKWMILPKFLQKSIETGFGLLELRSGRGSERNTGKPGEASAAAPPTTTTTAPTATATTPAAKKPTLEELMAKFPKK